MTGFIYFIAYIFINILIFGNCVRTSDKIYSSILGASCYRRLNATHQTGCSSSYTGSVGVIHLIKTSQDFDFVANQPPSPPYAPVIPSHLFTRENILRLKNEARQYISAIILINKIDKLFSFSHELKCPNQFSGLVSEQTCDPNKKETTWNPFGTGLLHEDFPFPIYFVEHPEEIEKIINCFDKFNNFDLPNQNKRSLCSIQVNSFMSAAVNSEVCIRRTNFVNNLSPTRYCDPLQGKNIYATLFPREIVSNSKSEIMNQNEKFILVSCRMDTTSFFDGVGLGAMDSLVSFATLVNIGHFLSRILPQPYNTKNVIFTIFNGESYDYIGSQRFVYDLKKNIFPSSSNPIKMENIELMIDIGTLDDLDNIELHHAKPFDSVHNLTVLLKKYSEYYKFDININTNESLNLPPTSAQSFLRENITFPAIIVTSKPLNKFYHSIYDTADNIHYEYKNTSADFTKLEIYNKNDRDNKSIQNKIQHISTILTLAIYEIITGLEYRNDTIASSTLADEFLHCFLESADCPLFKAASYPNSLPGAPIPPLRYISVHGSSQEAAIWTYRLFGLVTGQIWEKVPKENCTKSTFHWIAGYDGKGVCISSTQNYSPAYSPAFFEEDYDWKSGKYSTWTESTWLPLSARIFLRPSGTHEAVTLAIGFVVLIISFVVIFLLNSRSDALFGNSPSSSTLVVSEPAAC